MRTIRLIAACLAISATMAAQPKGQEPRQKDRGHRQQMTVQQEAQMRVDAMAAELPLTEKQVKKLVKFYKNDIEYRRENFGGGRGPRPEGMEGHGGPQGGRGGMRPGGGPGMGGPGGGMGPGNGHSGGGPGMRPDVQGDRPPMGGEVDFEKMEKYNQKQEKKLHKILGDELYARWCSSHPAEAPKLPDIELK